MSCGTPLAEPYVGNKEARAGGGVGHHPGITRAPYQLAWPGVGHTPGFTAACLPQMRGITQPWLQRC